MPHSFAEIAFTPSVRAAQDRYGSREQNQRLERNGPTNDRLGPAEAAFIAERDGFFMATVGETGWPYVQFRGGPKGFLKALDETTLGYADFRGNRQYLSVGNLRSDDRVALILVDWAHRRRLKLLGRVAVVDADAAPDMMSRLEVPGYRALIERAMLIRVAAFDWNCPQHITPRFTEAEILEATAPLRERLSALEAENARLRQQLALDSPI